MVDSPKTPGRNEPSGAIVRRNFQWIIIGNVVYAGSLWLMTVLLAKAGSPTMVGQFSLGLAIAAPVLLFANLQLRTVQATDVTERYAFADYLAVRFLTTGLAIAVITVIALVIAVDSETRGVIVVLGFARGIEAISDVHYGFWMRREQMARIGKSMVARGLMGVFTLALVLWWSGSLVFGCWTLVAVSLGLLLGYDRRRPGPACADDRRAGTIGTLRDRGVLMALVREAYPLGVSGGLIALIPNIPKYFVQYHLGTAALGMYSAVAYAAGILLLPVNALGQVVIPRFSRLLADGNREGVRRLLLGLIGWSSVVGVVSVVVVAIAGEAILTRLYAPPYASAANVFVALAVSSAIAFSVTFMASAILARKLFRQQVPLMVGVAVAATIAAAIFVPQWGLIGAGYAACVGSVVHVVGSLVVLRIRSSQPGGAER